MWLLWGESSVLKPPYRRGLLVFRSLRAACGDWDRRDCLFEDKGCRVECSAAWGLLWHPWAPQGWCTGHMKEAPKWKFERKRLTSDFPSFSASHSIWQPWVFPLETKSLCFFKGMWNKVQKRFSSSKKLKWGLGMQNNTGENKEMPWVFLPFLPLTSCVALRNPYKLSSLLFPHL